MNIPTTNLLPLSAGVLLVVVMYWLWKLWTWGMVSLTKSLTAFDDRYKEWDAGDYIFTVLGMAAWTLLVGYVQLSVWQQIIIFIRAVV